MSVAPLAYYTVCAYSLGQVELVLLCLAAIALLALCFFVLYNRSKHPKWFSALAVVLAGLFILVCAPFAFVMIVLLWPASIPLLFCWLLYAQWQNRKPFLTLSTAILALSLLAEVAGFLFGLNGLYLVSVVGLALFCCIFFIPKVWQSANDNPPFRGQRHTLVLLFVILLVSGMLMVLPIAYTASSEGGVNTLLVWFSLIAVLLLVSGLGKTLEEWKVSQSIFSFLASAVLVVMLFFSIFIILQAVHQPAAQKCTGFSNPDILAGSALTEIYRQGFGISTPQRIEFKRSSALYARTIIANVKLPLKETELGFACQGQSCSAFTITSNALQVNSDSSGYVVVCGDDSRKQDPKYCVGLGRLPEDAVKACTGLCDIK